MCVCVKCEAVLVYFLRQRSSRGRPQGNHEEADPWPREVFPAGAHSLTKHTHHSTHPSIQPVCQSINPSFTPSVTSFIPSSVRQSISSSSSLALSSHNDNKTRPLNCLLPLKVPHGKVFREMVMNVLLDARDGCWPEGIIRNPLIVDRYMQGIVRKIVTKESLYVIVIIVN